MCGVLSEPLQRPWSSDQVPSSDSHAASALWQCKICSGRLIAITCPWTRSAPSSAIHPHVRTRRPSARLPSMEPKLRRCEKKHGCGSPARLSPAAPKCQLYCSAYMNQNHASCFVHVPALSRVLLIHIDCRLIQSEFTTTRHVRKQHTCLRNARQKWHNGRLCPSCTARATRW